MKTNIYIQEYNIRGGQDEESGKETKCSKIMVKGENPEQELWDKVLGEISGGYEQRLFVNDDDFDCVGSDEAVEKLRKEGMEAFKKEHDIKKITAMGYYDDAWSGYMSDQTFYRIKKSKPKKKTPTVGQIKAAVLRYLDGKFETAEVVDDYRKVVVEGLQASYTNKEELRADVERIFEEGEDFFSDEK